jgi:hypothetical protein
VARLVFPNGNGRVEYHAKIASRGFYALQTAAGLVGADGKPKYGLCPATFLRVLGDRARLFTKARAGAARGQLDPDDLDVYGHVFPSLEDDHAKFAAGELTIVGC